MLALSPLALQHQEVQQPYILAIDAGTTGVTTLLFDSDLRVVRRITAEFPQHFPRPGEVEHHASEILDAVDSTVAQVLASYSGPIAALGLTNQRETIFALRRSSGEALVPGIVWQDRRTSGRCQELRDQNLGPRVHKKTGLVLDPYFSATKAEWMLKHQPQVAKARADGDLLFATVDTLIALHLIGPEGALTDPTNASRTMLMNIEEGGWCPEMGELFGVASDELAEIRPSAGDFGLARLPGGREVPLTGIAGDQQAALFGQGCFDEGSLKNTYGTGCFLLLNTGARRVDSTHGLLTTLAADRKGGTCFALEGSVFMGGATIQWLRDELGILKDAAESETLAASVGDTGGVFLVPAFAGLGAPHWDPEARGALLGLTRGTGRGHIARAALEGIAFQCTELVEALRRDTGLPVDELLVDGGAAANDLLMQLQADLAGVRVRRPQDLESTARGAAALAAMGAGLLDDPSKAAGIGSGADEFLPSIDRAARGRRLQEWATAVDRVGTGPFRC